MRFLYFSRFIFKENHVFHGEENPSQKAVIVEEELNDIDTEDIENLEDIPKFVFIDQEC